MQSTRRWISLFTVLLLTACGGDSENTSQTVNSGSAPQPDSTGVAQASISPYGQVSQERLTNAADEPEQWMMYGGTYTEQRYSALEQINTDNVSDLGLAWYANLETNRGQQSTPVYVDGMLYVTESWSKVSAFDATTGERVWFFDPAVPGEYGGRGCCDVVNRGVAVYEGNVYVGTYDGRLIALNAANGEVVWETDAVVDRELNYTSSGAPRVANGKVFIGDGGAEYKTRGYMSAFDAATGELIWRFYTVPGNPELGFENDAMRMAAETWSGEWWELGGGGSTWDGITYDPETNLLMFGVGNGSPWNPQVRSPEGGDNLFTVSIVAVDADTGEYVWHFQEIPNDEWDFDAVQQIMIADLEVDGEMRHVAMQAAKNGYFYMLDAYTGQLLKANNFVSVNWTFGYDMLTGRPNINPAAQYTQTDEATIIQPGPAGAHNWQPMSMSQDTGLLYIPALESNMAFRSAPGQQIGAFNLGIDWTGGEEAYEDPDNTIQRENRGRLVAWDPVAAEEVWSIEDVSIGGTLTTAGGLLIKGNGRDENIGIYNAENGAELWKMDTRAGASAGPITYMHEGEQFIAHVVGGSAFGGYYAPTYARVLVYKLGGTEALPEKAEFTQRPFAPPEETASEDVIAQGEIAYNNNCAMCHGNGGANRGMFPVLRRSPLLHSTDGFTDVVIDGILSERGMVSFAQTVTEQDADAIRHYLVSLAHIAMNQPQFGPVASPDNNEESPDNN